MSESTEGSTTSGEGIPARGEPTTEATTAKPETDWRAEAKKWESRAKENKSAADRLAEIENAAKSETEKTAERLAAADAAVAKVPQLVAEQLRSALVELHSISDEDAELFLTAADPALLRRQADRLVAQRAEATAASKKQGNRVPREGTTSTAPENEERAVARELFGGQ